MATNVTYTYPKITLIHWDFISDMFKLKLYTNGTKLYFAQFFDSIYG